MSGFDQIKNIVGKAKAAAVANSDKVDKVMDKAGNLVNSKTGRKYAGTVDKVQEAARKITKP